MADPTRPSASVDIDIIGSSSHSPPPAKAETETTIAHAEEEAQEDTEAQDIEIDVIKPISPGNFNTDPAQVDYSSASHELDELLAYYLSLDVPLSPIFARNTDV